MPSNDGNEDSLDSILQSCASIQKRARSTKTLSFPASKRRPTDSWIASNTAIRIGEEQQVAENLEREIQGYRAKISTIKHNRLKTTNDPPDPKAVGRQQRLLQSQLMDESLRQQQEKLLLNQMAMAKPAGEVACHSRSLRNEPQLDNQMVLIQETIECRNKLAQKTMETQQKLDRIRKEISSVTLEGHEIQTKNQKAWDNLQKPRHQRNSSPASQTDNRLGEETLVLKRVLAELIAGSNLDWCSDPRIQATLMRLE